MASKQAACMACRRSKIRCKRGPGADACEKCLHSGTECVVPGGFHIGRQKGVRNKRTGLEKALHQIEEAIKKSKSDPSSSGNTVEQLQQLLLEARGSRASSNSSPSSSVPAPSEGVAHVSDDQQALDDAENPLQLLARASDLRLTSPQSNDHPFTPSTSHLCSDVDQQSDVHRFFLPIKASLDRGPSYDPIDLGLVTEEEAELLLSFYHEKLAHTRWGTDKATHTLAFCRGQSAFLLTSLLAASSLFLPSAAAMCKRLLVHRKFMAEQVIARRLRSVEIVIAFMVNVPWMHPGLNAGDDDTGLYMSTALSIALDLSLNKIIVPSSCFDQDILKRVPKGHCLDARKALTMDGFEDVEITSEFGKQMLRRRERAWIALFVLDRGIGLARGRAFCATVTPLITYCDIWHIDMTPDPQDGPLVSMAVLRRDLDDLFRSVRSKCDSYQSGDVGSKVAEDIESTIEGFFNTWIAKWTHTIGEGEQKILPPYVEILLPHTRLSAYSHVINHPTAPLEVKRLLRGSTLSAALNVMRVAIQGEVRLKSMPNNTVTMICFAACVALTLSAPSPYGSYNLAPSVRNLIEETATVLERIGSTPSHRNGASVIYGKSLRELVKRAPELPPPVPPPASFNYVSQPQAPTNSLFAPAADLLQSSAQPQYQLPNQWPEPLQFSAMSGNEIIETVMNVGDFNSSLLDIPMQDPNSFMWMDWINPLDPGF
ncbi:uncharacterized protein N0V89_000767 [Didymosphaeria variabile]|uniref:Zn(2)-C6 fungal-type domain-containing protein n=1 Tax=Didymosphaeria variabile TaxID=1932322 RepID=A0A9W8XXE6_9PLEO|nr:uncharacterized protein N0V89_000767 [Didymosphaeria variabile]KAJ4360207.1 hypothetical protein N0V89_000767 [Didymosphaeria variabile]